MHANKDMKRMNAKMNERDGIKKRTEIWIGFVLDTGQKNMSQTHLAQGSYSMIRMFSV
jgi:hypothetical protein